MDKTKNQISLKTERDKVFGSIANFKLFICTLNEIIPINIEYRLLPYILHLPLAPSFHSPQNSFQK